MNVYQTAVWGTKQLDLFPRKDAGGGEILALGSSLQPARASCLARAAGSGVQMLTEALSTGTDARVRGRRGSEGCGDHDALVTSVTVLPPLLPRLLDPEWKDPQPLPSSLPSGHSG